MFSHLPRHAALAGCLVLVLGSTALVVQAATVGLKLAPGLSPDERVAIERQVADTLGSQAEACQAVPETDTACVNVPEARPGRHAGVAAPDGVPLNREQASQLSHWMQQRRLDRDRVDNLRPLLVLVRNGQVESGWLWRNEVPLDTAPLIRRREGAGRIESGAVLGEFFRHSRPLDIEVLRWLPRQWRVLKRDGWHILRYGDLRSGHQPTLERSPFSAPSPWELSR